MTSLRRTFRLWWQPPRRLMDRETDRQVTFLELFYDLVYVARRLNVVIARYLSFAESAHVVWSP